MRQAAVGPESRWTKRAVGREPGWADGCSAQVYNFGPAYAAVAVSTVGTYALFTTTATSA